MRLQLKFLFYVSLSIYIDLNELKTYSSLYLENSRYRNERNSFNSLWA